MNEREAKRRADKIVGKNLDKLGRGLGLEALARVMRRTPIDTGHARGNWNASVGAGDYTVVDGRTEADALTEGKARIDSFRLSTGEPLHVSNGVPYIERLEHGWSKQAPQGMARLTAQELKPLADSIARRASRG